MNSEIIKQLAPTGVLRAAINMSNGLLVTGKTATGDPDGVSPDMARAIAKELGVPCQLIPYDGPGLLADAVADDVWDIGNIANEPARAKTIAFSPAYSEIQATYLLPPNSPIRRIEQVDQPGVRIVTKDRAAYCLWLEDNIQKATLIKTDTAQGAFEQFVEQQYEVLASLRPAMHEWQQKLPGSVVMEESFTAVKQSIGCQPGLGHASAYLADFVQRSISDGFVQNLIEKHGVVGRLSVASS